MSVKALLIGLAILFSLVWLMKSEKIGTLTSGRGSDSSPFSTEQQPSYPQETLPANGTLQVFVASERVAPLEIHASVNSSFLVKLVDWNSKMPVLNVFVRNGSTIQVDVPLGKYEIRYASGQAWYGYNHLFGPKTAYSKADEDFDFRESESEVIGYTVTLYAVPNGNLQTRRISAEEF